ESSNQPQSSPSSHRKSGSAYSAAKPLVRDIWDQRQLTGTLDRRLQFALMHRARAGNPPRQDFAALRHERTEQLHVFVVDIVDFIRAEFADLTAPEHRPALSLLLVFVFFVAPAAAAARASLSKWHRYASIPSNRSSSRSSVSVDRPSPG